MVTTHQALTFPKSVPSTKNVNITIHPDAYISSQGLQVTSDERTNLEQRAGKATYRDPLHLWDKASGDLADFSTHFAFVIDSYGSLDYADGLTFFLAPTRANITVGGAMGLPVDPRRSNRPVLLSPWSLIPIGIGIQTRSTSIMVLIVESGLRLLVDLRDCGLPEWVEFGFSASTEPGSDPVTPTPKKRKAKNTGLVVGLIVGSCALVGGLALLGFGLWNRSRGKEEDKEFEIDMSMENEFETGVFLRDLNSYVAVKRISKGSKQGIKEYASEVRIISRLRHRNLVQLIGWCHEKKELLLVYEFMENGSLDSHLFKGKTMLTWAMRCKIVQGLASALLYLHEEWEQCVVHRDVKSSNVMLDSNFNAKLGDFGLARLVDHEKGSQTTVLAGTMGYLAPECVVTGKASKETDVYSFGVVALEIACGRKPFDLKVQESQMRMVEWVWDLYGTGKLLEAADPKLSTDFDEKEMECLMVVGLWCAHPDHTLRPSIRQAIQVLNFEAPLPILPAKLPALTFFCPPVNSPTSLISLVPGTTISNTSSSYYYNTDSSKLTSSSAASSPSASFLHTK
ncbi:concanavalin A-like lectin protein kinase family protein [Actinidia rufa]|uniref:Concanavalin A-like lectin protein kinase family protein n=1 Tax=Actinidia rufa TaxID=165716 RepID=A0A7J0DHV6_9ERIC|nr:concanavalin A-like lectin protein kinase family protein [Actinidia rufa]